jgi:hypothetical protein
VFLASPATIAMQPTRGGRRAALWLAVLAVAVAVVGLAEPAQRAALLFSRVDEVTVFAWAFHASLVGLVLSCVGEVRRASTPVVGVDEADVPAGGEPVAAGRAGAALTGIAAA